MEEVKRGYEAVYKSRGHIILDNFLGGLAWGVGTVIGASVIVGILALLLSKINLIPGIGTFIAQVIESVNQYGQRPFLQR